MFLNRKKKEKRSSSFDVREMRENYIVEGKSNVFGK